MVDFEKVNAGWNVFCKQMIVSPRLSLFLLWVSIQTVHCTKNVVSSRIYSGNVTFTEEILKGKLHFLYTGCTKMFCLPSVTKAYRYGKLQGKSWSTLFLFKKANEILLMPLCFLVESSQTFNSVLNGKVVYLLFKYCFLVMMKSVMIFYEKFFRKRKREEKCSL